MLDALKKHVHFWWLYLALLLLLSGMILGAGHVFLQKAKESAIRSALDELRHIAEFKAEQVARWRDVRMNIANTLVINPAVAQWLDKLLQNPSHVAVREEIFLWMQKMEGKYGHGDAALVTASGQVVLTVKPDFAVLLPAVQQVMAEAARTGLPQLSDLYLTTNALPARMVLAIPFATPAETGSGSRSFCLLIRINPYEYLFKLLQSWPVPTSSGESLLFRREQDAVVLLNEPRLQQHAALTFRQPLTNSQALCVQAVQGQRETADGVDERNKRVLAAMTAIPKSPWFLVVKQDREDVLARMDSTIRMTWWIMLASIAGVGLLLGLLALNTWLHAVRREGEWAEEYRQLFDHMGDAVFVKNTQGQVLMANTVAVLRYGYTQEEWQLIKTTALSAPEELPRLPGVLQTLAREGQVVFVTVHCRKDGTRMPVEVNVRRTTFRGLPAEVNVIRDLSQRRDAEAEYEKQRQLLLTLINALPDLIYVKDAQHRFLLANTSTAHHMGVATPADLLGKTDLDVYSPDIAAGYLTDERAILTTGQPLLNREERSRAPDGREVWFSSTKVPLRDREDRVIGLVGIGHDVTALKHLNEKLEQALARSLGLELAINRSPAVVLLRRAGLESPLEYVSENVRRWGYSAAELVGQTELPWLHPDDCGQVQTEIRRQLAGQATEFMLSYRLLTRDGEVRWIEDYCRVAGEEPSTIRQAQSLLMDVTEHRALEEKLQQAQRLETVGRLAGGIAHDFNNLLQVILGFAELLAGDLAEGDRHRRDVREIQTAAQRARDLTNRLLAFSRKQMIVPALTDLNTLIAGTRDQLARLLGEQITVQTELATDLWPVMVDQGQFQQIILNLAANAREAMPQGGRLACSTRNLTFYEEDLPLHTDAQPGPFVCCAIADTGGGMSAEVRAHLFEPFFTTKEPGHGTGLGLAMAYGIIKQHGGWIHVYSQSGSGTTFKLYLPAQPAAGAVAPAVQQLAGLQVLLIEDEEGVRHLANRILRGRGCTVTPARTIAEAEELWRKASGHFDVVLCDVVLPDGNGIDLVERWRAAGTQVPIVLTSGYTDERVRWPLIVERGYRYLQKPYPAGELARLLAQAAGRT